MAVVIAITMEEPIEVVTHIGGSTQRQTSSNFVDCLLEVLLTFNVASVALSKKSNLG